MIDAEFGFKWTAPLAWIYTLLALCGICMTLVFAFNAATIWAEKDIVDVPQALGILIGLIFVTAASFEEKSYRRDRWLRALSKQYPKVTPKAVKYVMKRVNEANTVNGTSFSTNHNDIVRALVFMHYHNRRPTTKAWQFYNSVFEELIVATS